MTTLAINHLLRQTPAALYRAGQRISEFLDGIEEARAMAELFKSLSRMSDDQLAERGLRREDIPRAIVAAFSHR
jgi:uncharacterized protein YjiS (DUF1127 family)